jgi:acetyl-CoA carboxylase carboxyl transferase subunit beta
MNWLTNFVRPKIQALIQRNTTTEDLWTKCPSCERMLFKRDLESYIYVCHHCQHHMRMSTQLRFESLFDDKSFQYATIPNVPHDPIKFKDTKKYSDRLKDYRAKTNLNDSVQVAMGKVGGYGCVSAAFDFSFMGGSMGMAAGQALMTAADLAVQHHVPLLVIPASGGARMQEGILSLMQMPRTTIAVQKVREAGLPYIVLLTDPTTGGVSASFAMLGDITLAEPDALIGFTGARVIQETVRQKLPEGFQRSEYLMEHGMVDMVVHRHKLKETLTRLFSFLTPPHHKGLIQ